MGPPISTADKTVGSIHFSPAVKRVYCNARCNRARTTSVFQPKTASDVTRAGRGLLLQYSIQPGTYSFRLTNPTLAAAEFPTLTGSQLGQIFTAWTYNSPWITDYFVFDAAGAAATNLPQIFAGAIRPAPRPIGEVSAAAAFNHAVANDYDDNVTKQPGGRNTGVRVTNFTFATAETLTFAVPDNVLSDNTGGLSVVVTRVIAPGDYNANGVVDAADYVVWRKTDGTLAGYNLWRTHFGQPSGSGSSVSVNSAVPEPATPVLLMLAAAGWCLRRSRSA